MSALNKNQASIGALLMSAKCQQQTFSLSLDIIDSVPETVRKLAGRHHETSPPEILAPGGGCRFTIRNIKYRGRSNVGFTAGSPTDILARLIGQWLSERLGQPFVVEDRPGAATNIATEEVAHAPPDGYTLLAAVSTNTINPARDIAMVAGLTRSAEVLEVNPALPVTSVSELIAYVRTNPGKLSLGSFGTGTISHVAGVMFKREAGIEMVHVPYRGSAPLVSICSQDKSRSPSTTSSRPSSTSRRANCVRSRSRVRRACHGCRTFQRSPISCQGMRSPGGLASRLRRTRPSQSSTGSMRRSTLD